MVILIQVLPGYNDTYIEIANSYLYLYFLLEL